MEQLGPYRIDAALASGGMGEVYLATKLGPAGFTKPVVLKTVRRALASDEGLSQLFLEEARLAAHLEHPHIAAVYDFGVSDGTYFIAMEHVRGYTLHELIQKFSSIGARMPPEHVAFIGSQLCLGLHYAHTRVDREGHPLGLVHRDVCPQNIMIRLDGSAKLLDFGVARVRHGLATVETAASVGRPAYASPEQLRGEDVDGRSDLFSLGVCLWELSTGTQLFAASADTDRATEVAPSLRAWGTPREFADIVAQALAWEREGRFSDARAMHRACERFLSSSDHVAGQERLEGYLEDLRAGRIEHPDPRITGELVEPVVGDGSVTDDGGAALAGIRRFEEVYGSGVTGDVAPMPGQWHVGDGLDRGGPSDRDREAEADLPRKRLRDFFRRS